jgi:pyridoxal 5'-phosphate synthase glutaminase subunit Pdx2
MVVICAKMVRIGVLALQGSFREHIICLKRCGVDCLEVRTKEDLDSCDGLIIPGGESTTMAHVAEKTGMLAELRKFVNDNSRPVWGTCAGLIFLAESAEGAEVSSTVKYHPETYFLACLSISVSGSRVSPDVLHACRCTQDI